MIDLELEMSNTKFAPAGLGVGATAGVLLGAYDI